jgi:hypothetical protein
VPHILRDLAQVPYYSRGYSDALLASVCASAAAPPVLRCNSSQMTQNLLLPPLLLLQVASASHLPSQSCRSLQLPATPSPLEAAPCLCCWCGPSGRRRSCSCCARHCWHWLEHGACSSPHGSSTQVMQHNIAGRYLHAIRQDDEATSRLWSVTVCAGGCQHVCSNRTATATAVALQQSQALFHRA